MVMTAGGKDDPEEFKPFARDRAQEAAVKGRFRDYDDPLQLLIVTAKLLTGFDAPIEGVLYLDKPLKRHTLFQAMTRTNRRWTNPDTGQEKTAGLVVDYVGLGKQIAEAMKRPGREGGRYALETGPLIEELVAELDGLFDMFDGIDRSKADWESLMAAQQRIPPGEARDAFDAAFLKAHALWELLWPMPSWSRHRRAIVAGERLPVRPTVADPRRAPLAPPRRQDHGAHQRAHRLCHGSWRFDGIRHHRRRNDQRAPQTRLRGHRGRRSAVGDASDTGAKSSRPSRTGSTRSSRPIRTAPPTSRSPRALSSYARCSWWRRPTASSSSRSCWKQPATL